MAVGLATFLLSHKHYKWPVFLFLLAILYIDYMVSYTLQHWLQPPAAGISYYTSGTSDGTGWTQSSDVCTQSSDVLTFEVLNNPRRSHQPHSHFELCSLIKKNFIHNHSYIKIFGWEYVSYHVASNDFSLGSEYLELCSLTKKLICNHSYTKYFQKISLIIKSIYKDMLKTICAILISRVYVLGRWKLTPPPLCFGIWCILYLRMDGT